MKYFLLVALVPLIMFANAQGSKKNIEKYPNYKWKKKLKIARLKITQGSYYNAAVYLEDVYREKPDKVEVPHLLGEVNRQLRDYEAAEKYYSAAVKLNPEAYPNDHFFLGQMLKMNGKYEDAKKSFESYLKQELGKNDRSYKSLTKNEIAGCDSALVIVANPTKIKVQKTEGAVNTVLQDFSPKPLKNGDMMYARQKTDTAVNVSTSKADYYTGIYTSSRSGNTFGAGNLLPFPPNDSKTNVGNAIYSADRKSVV